MLLTDTGNEVVEPFLGKEGVLQPPEVELQHTGHRVDVMVILLVNQGVVTLATERRTWLVSFPLTWKHKYDDLTVTSHLSQMSS